MQYPLIPFKETNDRLSQYIFDLKDDRNLNLYTGLKKHLMKLSLLKQGIPHQKHLKGREP